MYVGTCIPSMLVCNLKHDCNDGSDEAQCVNVTCQPNQFVCADNSRCIPAVWRCDGSEDCADGSDEKTCASLVLPYQFIAKIIMIVLIYLRLI